MRVRNSRRSERSDGAADLFEALEDAVAEGDVFADDLAESIPLLDALARVLASNVLRSGRLALFGELDVVNDLLEQRREMIHDLRTRLVARRRRQVCALLPAPEDRRPLPTHEICEIDGGFAHDGGPASRRPSPTSCD